MEMARHAELGARFRALHRSGCFLLANVGDAGTAKALGEAGVDAIATSSSAHAETIGRADAAGDVTMEEHAEHTAALVAAGDLPLNVDAENGYGHEPETMAAAVQRFAATGAAGMGIEDWSGDAERGLYDRALAVARIEAAVEAANALDRPFVITGRTEVLLYGLDGGMAEALARLQAFADVGAECLYAPGTWDLESIRTVAAEAGGPTNILVPIGSSLTFDEVAEAGARRISIGGSLYTAQVAHGRTLVDSIRRTGSFRGR
ncbi:MAG: isocitrate lyase/phosphoenolpyruvate mutase family protein [Acidimicrobiales bacterium]